MNASLTYRLEGNKIYKSINNNLPPTIFLSRLNEAQKLYNLALHEALNKVDQSSACKNLSAISFRFQEFYSVYENNSQKHYFYSELAQKYAYDALTHSKNVQNSEWVAKIKLDAIKSFNRFYENILNYNYEKRVDNLVDLKRSSIDEVCVLINYRICECYFRMAADLMNSNLYLKALAANNECDFYYEESIRHLNNDENMINMIKELKEDFILQRFCLEGFQSKIIAQKMLDQCINEHEILNMELIWDIIDRYRDAISKLKGKDIECEAELTSDLGYIYDKVIKNKDKAKDYYKLSWYLADSLRPKVLTHFKWYKRCANAIERYQQELLEKERNSFEAQRQKIYEKIKNDIEKLREKAKEGSYKFLPFIYSNYPPKNPNHSFKNDLNSKNLKRSIQTAICHYHPDKNPKQEYGNEWYFIVDEITKILTNFYEKLKSLD